MAAANSELEELVAQPNIIGEAMRTDFAGWTIPKERKSFGTWRERRLIGPLGKDKLVAPGITETAMWEETCATLKQIIDERLRQRP